MKLVTCRFEKETWVGILEDDQVILPALQPDFDLPEWRDMLTLINSGLNLHTVRSQIDHSAAVPLKRVELLSPIPRPRNNVMCLGLNYMDHAQESASKVGREAKKPDFPIVFTKSASTVIGPGAQIPFDSDTCSELDWEVELGVVMGTTAKKIAEADALEHVFGYTVVNDISARDIQRQHKQWFLGKSLDGGCPIGPCIVTADEIPDPQQLAIECRVNGTLKQQSNTRHMMFSVASIIAWLSRGLTLEAGDVIATGTPAGVGFARQPPEFLTPGDTVDCEINGVGVLRNTISQDNHQKD